MRPVGERLDRLYDLLADATGADRLAATEERELFGLLEEFPEVDPESFDRAAAAVHLAFVLPALEEFPPGLRSRVLVTGGNGLALDVRALEHERPSGVGGAWGWVAAAATLLLFLFATQHTSSAGSPTLDVVSAASDVSVARWTPVGEFEGSDVGGEVLWSNELQAGYMRFRGLGANDPSEAQYQLWIFDAERSAEHPVDGGVFDSTGGEVTVAIDAKLDVATPTLFAVTLERPGGVVVSSRETLILTASMP